MFGRSARGGCQIGHKSFQITSTDILVASSKLMDDPHDDLRLVRWGTVVIRRIEEHTGL